ncbi:MAG TPA: PTS transporter subunit EIIC [Mycobacteriales bacterium]|nr:PTS transporter subunit EIIC [Mycobacteriales bacterium]
MASTAVTVSRTSSAFAVLQRIGRSLMMPIAVLPAAAILLRLGQADMLGDDGLAQYGGLHWLHNVAAAMAAAGGAVFDNLPLLFALGVAIGYARRADGSTALAAVVGYLTFNGVYTSLTKDLDTSAVPGVLGGITIGLTAAILWQRFHRVKLVPWLAFFGGRRFVPILMAVAGLLIGVVFRIVWPWVGDHVLTPLGTWTADNGAAGAGIYGVVNRGLLPFGLHHVVNSLVWFSIGDCTNAAGQVQHGDLTCYFAGQDGTGTFMAGFFPVMMFGLPAAALAMVHEARPERRKVIGGIMIAAAVTSLVTGVTEPIEFSFLFVAPALFAVHALLTGVSMALAALLNVKIGFGFSAGLIDYLLNFGKSNTHNPLLILPIGVVYAVVYYFLFRFLIRRFNLMTPGREPDPEAQSQENSLLPAEMGPDASADSEPAVASSATTGHTGDRPPA